MDIPSPPEQPRGRNSQDAQLPAAAAPPLTLPVPPRPPPALTGEVVEGGGDVLGGVPVGGVAHHQAGLLAFATGANLSILES